MSNDAQIDHRAEYQRLRTEERNPFAAARYAQLHPEARRPPPVEAAPPPPPPAEPSAEAVAAEDATLARYREIARINPGAAAAFRLRNFRTLTRAQHRADAHNEDTK